MLGELGKGILINFTYSILNDIKHNALSSDLKDQLQESLQKAFDKVSSDFGVNKDIGKSTFWDTVSEKVYYELKDTEFKNVAIGDWLENQIKEFIAEDIEHDFSEICESFWNALHMEIAVYDKLYRYYMLSTNKQQIDTLLDIQDAVNEIKQRDTKSIEYSAGSIYFELSYYTDSLAEMKYTYADINTLLSRRDFKQEQEFRRNFTQFSYLASISEDWQTNLSIIKSVLVENNIDQKQILDFYRAVGKCVRFTDKEHIRGIVVSMPTFIFTSEFNKLYDRLDRVHEHYSVLSNERAGNDMTIINRRDECIKINEKLTRELKKFSPENIINDEWKLILDRIEKISLGEL